MKAKFISHPDFFDLAPICVYHKERGADGKLIFDRHADDGHPIIKNHPKELYNKHILFRKKVSLGAFRSATLKITADDYYKLYVNGKFVAQGPAPAYHFHYY